VVLSVLPKSPVSVLLSSSLPRNGPYTYTRFGMILFLGGGISILQSSYCAVLPSPVEGKGPLSYVSTLLKI